MNLFQGSCNHFIRFLRWFSESSANCCFETGRSISKKDFLQVFDEESNWFKRSQKFSNWLFPLFQNDESNEISSPFQKSDAITFFPFDLNTSVLELNKKLCFTVIILVSAEDHYDICFIPISVLYLLKTFKWCWEICFRFGFFEFSMNVALTLRTVFYT